MGQPPVFVTESVVPAEKQPTRYSAGFWRRFFALVIDGFLISIPSFLIGSIFYDFFSSSSGWASIVGFVITLPYFAILGSSTGNGQTLGQRWTGIEVVNAQGNHLSLEKSTLRYTILLVPFLFGEAGLPSPLAWAVGLAGAAIVYLYLFNTPSRQTLHDLATGSFVVESPAVGIVEERRPWPGHWAILGLLGILSLIVTPLVTRTGPFPELLAVQRALLDTAEFRDVGVMLQTVQPSSQTGLHLTVVCKNRPADYEKAGAQIVAVVERTDPQAAKRDFIAIDFKEGFHVGLARFSRTRTVNHSPQHWEDITRAEAN